MSYSTSQNVTPIELLPELEELERDNANYSNTYPGAGMLPPEQSDKFKRFIRGNHAPPSQSGLAPQSQRISELYGNPIEREVFNEINYHPPLNCLDVANHISNCPICSKIHNNDKTIYIIAIILLAIICILLLKKVLDV